MLTPDSPARDIFAYNVYRFRKAQGLTQAGLAARAGYGRVKAERVSDLEQGSHAPTLTTVDRIARALGVTAAQMLTCPGRGTGDP